MCRPARSSRASRLWRMRTWSSSSRRDPRDPDRHSPAHEAGFAEPVRPIGRDRLADPVRDDRLLPARRQARAPAAAQCVARRLGDADVVARRDRLERRARAATLARDPGARRRGAHTPHRSDRPDLRRGGARRHLRDRSHTRLGSALFDVPVKIDQPLAFAVGVPACALAVGMLGLILAATFVLYRAAFHLGIATQYPVWIVTGLLVPISLLPSFVRPISWLLAPTWGFRAIQEAALGRTPWPDIGMCFVLSAVYLVIGGSCLVAFEYVARSRGSLRLT